jgi:hypothetical protein
MTDSSDIDWQEMGADGREVATRVFDALETFRILQRPTSAEAESVGRPSPSSLWAFATGATARPSPELAAALMREPSLRLDVAAMLARSALGEAPRVAAAATAVVATERLGKGFSLRLLPSRANPAQTYVLIRLEDPELPAVRLVAMTQDGMTATLDLDAADQDEIQMLCASDDPMIQAIADPEARIWLL